VDRAAVRGARVHPTIPFLGAIAALLLARSARRDILASGGRLTGLSLCTWAVVLSWVHLVFVVLLALLFLAIALGMLVSVTSDPPMLRQRVAAYAVVLREGDEVLLTQLSALTTAPGRWTLPGGGIDHGEHPADAVAREGLEETGLTIEVGQLLGVDSRHIVGTSPRACSRTTTSFGCSTRAPWPPTPPVPRVVEVDGTTAAVAWHPLDAVSSGAVDAVELVHTAIALLSEATDRSFDPFRSTR
jgi:ADP-ribose pyrophosphatase YjhB (NUDIX family)